MVSCYQWNQEDARDCGWEICRYGCCVPNEVVLCSQEREFLGPGFRALGMICHLRWVPRRLNFATRSIDYVQDLLL